jgi:hypothetical protein
VSQTIYINAVIDVQSLNRRALEIKKHGHVMSSSDSKQKEIYFTIAQAKLD